MIVIHAVTIATEHCLSQKVSDWFVMGATGTANGNASGSVSLQITIYCNHNNVVIGIATKPIGIGPI